MVVDSGVSRMIDVVDGGNGVSEVEDGIEVVLVVVVVVEVVVVIVVVDGVEVLVEVDKVFVLSPVLGDWLDKVTVVIG